MNIGRKIYYELSTGNIVCDTGERSGSVIPTTVEQDFAAYSALTNRVPSSVGYKQLTYGQYAQDFAQCNGYRVDPVTLEVLFSYPDPNAPEESPVYHKSLTEQIAEQDARLADIELAMIEIFNGGAV